MCSEKSERNCITSYWYSVAILASFFLFACLKVLSSELVDQEQKNASGNQQKTRLEASKPPTYYTAYCGLKITECGVLPKGTLMGSIYIHIYIYIYVVMCVESFLALILSYT